MIFFSVDIIPIKIIFTNACMTNVCVNDTQNIFVPQRDTVLLYNEPILILLFRETISVFMGITGNFLTRYVEERSFLMLL